MKIGNRIISIAVALMALLLTSCDSGPGYEDYPVLPDPCPKGEHCGGVDPYREPVDETKLT